MTDNLRKTPAIIVIFVALICAVSTFGQIKTGGYKNASVNDAGVKEAANFAIETKAAELEQEISLEAIVKAETQTVAGTNYRLCLQLYAPAEEDETDGVQFSVTAIIFKNLKGEFALKSWDETECAEK